MGGRPIAKCHACGVLTKPATRYVSTREQRLGKRYFCVECGPLAKEDDRLAALRKTKGAASPASICESAASPNGRHQWQLVVGYERGVYGSHGTCVFCKSKRFYPSPQMGGWDSRQIFREHVA